MPDVFGISGRTALVTGASRGIGQAIARALTGAGATVIGTRTGGSGAGDEACTRYLVADFSSPEGIAGCAAQVATLDLDILVNNAGINAIAPFAEIDPADFLRIQQVNVFAPFMLCRAALPAMMARGWGRIVSLSSIWGKIGKEQRASYSASKFAIDGLTLALATEHAGNGILANCVAPGFTDTALTRRVLGAAGIAELVAKVPAGRMATTDDIAALVLWLASDANRYVSGQNIAIDGGFSRA